MNCGIVLSSGTGDRFGTTLPKQYNTINGSTVISYSIDALLQSDMIQKVIVTIDSQYQELIPNDERIECIEGGDTRNKSLKAALNHIKRTMECDNVIILEAARPMITRDIIDQYLRILEDGWDAVITGQRITDSLGCFDFKTVDRSRYYLIQAPEAFVFKKLNDYFDEYSPITATNQQLPGDSKVFINFDFKDNYKITYPEDLKMIENRMRSRDGL